MAGHVEFGDDADAAVARVGDDLADLVLRVEIAVGAHLLQLRKSLAFDAEALIVGEVPVEYVELHGGHGVEIALDHGHGHPVAGDIELKAAPGEARHVRDGHGRYDVAARAGLYELKKCLEAMQDAERIERFEPGALRVDGEFVALVFAECLDGLAGAFAADRRVAAAATGSVGSAIPVDFVS